MSASIFVDRSTAKQFECSICLDIYKNPVQIECEEHIYCKKCVDKLILTQGRKFKCPLCQRKCNAKVITRVKFIDRQINDLKVICPNGIKSKKTVLIGNKINNNNNNNNNNNVKPASRRRSVRLQQKTERDKENNSNSSNKISGRKRTRASIDENELSENCEWKGLYSDLNKHKSVCPLETIKCKYCSNSMPRQVLDKHYHICPRYPISCIQCGKIKICRNRMPSHIKIYCPMSLINCVRCNGEIIRKNAKVHLKDECPEFYIQCPFYKFGCQQLLKRKDFKQHIQNTVSIHNHLEKMANYQIKLEETVNELQSKNNELDSRMSGLQNENVALNTRLNNLEQQMQTQQQQHQNIGHNGPQQRQPQMNVPQNNQLQQQYSYYTKMLQNYNVMLQQNPSLQQDRKFMTQYVNVKGSVEQLQQQLPTCQQMQFNNMPYFG